MKRPKRRPCFRKGSEGKGNMARAPRRAQRSNQEVLQGVIISRCLAMRASESCLLKQGPSLPLPAVAAAEFLGLI